MSINLYLFEKPSAVVLLRQGSIFLFLLVLISYSEGPRLVWYRILA